MTGSALQAKTGWSGIAKVDAEPAGRSDRMLEHHRPIGAEEVVLEVVHEAPVVPLLERRAVERHSLERLTGSAVADR